MRHENKITTEEEAALTILRRSRFGVLGAAVLVGELERVAGGSEQRVRRGLRLMEEALQSERRTVSFARAAKVALEARSDRRQRTLADIRYITKRLLTRCKGLGEKKLRSITPTECAAWLEQAFPTPRQRLKAHCVLSGIFRTGEQRGWCAANPMQKVEKPRIIEKRIRILSRAEIARLLQAARRYRGGICLPAVALMLYAGLRPNEVARLRWGDLNLMHNCISILPQHSKTGGARQVSIQPTLRRILSPRRHAAEAPVCPRCWLLHWRSLHRSGGFPHWQPDVLRHTFASHHLACYRSYAALQLEMGHRSATLLRTRYVAMPEEKNIFRNTARRTNRASHEPEGMVHWQRYDNAGNMA